MEPRGGAPTLRGRAGAARSVYGAQGHHGLAFRRDDFGARASLLGEARCFGAVRPLADLSSLRAAQVLGSPRAAQMRQTPDAEGVSPACG